MCSTSDPHAGDVLAFWQAKAPAHGYPISEAASAVRVGEGSLHAVYLVRDGEMRAAVRWPRRCFTSMPPGSAQHQLAVLTAAADAGIAPRVLFVDDSASEVGGLPVVVSDYAAGDVGRLWFRDNTRQAAALLARLHRDETLARLLAHAGRGDPDGDCLFAARAAWADLRQRLGVLAARAWPEALRVLLDELDRLALWAGPQIQANSAAFRGQRVGPVHGDLNDSNWRIGADNRVYLVDWDQARLDDPALDVGMLLHWYVPPALWPLFARDYGSGGESPPDPAALLIRARVRYAMHALSVCLWLLEHESGLPEGEAHVLGSAAPFVDDLRHLRAGTFGAG